LLPIAILFITINGRSIEHESSIELIVKNGLSSNTKLTNTIASYRHRFEHSPNFKTLHWAFAQQSAPLYCDLCDVVIPAVSF
jgi:hypothetical protein